MKDYRYVLARKYPFVKKRELTETEIVEQRVMDWFYLLPVVYMVCFIAMAIGFISSLLKIGSGAEQMNKSIGKLLIVIAFILLIISFVYFNFVYDPSPILCSSIVPDKTYVDYIFMLVPFIIIGFMTSGFYCLAKVIGKNGL